MKYKLKNLQTAMRIKDISIRDLADEINIGKTSLHNKLNGKTELKLSEAIKIANYFNVSVDELFCSKISEVFLAKIVPKNDTNSA